MAQHFSIHGAKNCGVYELADIGSLPMPQHVIEATVIRLHEMDAVDFRKDDSRRAFLYFVGADRSGQQITWAHASRHDDYAGNLAQYIIDHDLGTVTVSSPSMNWTGNYLRMFVWAPNWDALRALWTKLVGE